MDKYHKTMVQNKVKLAVKQIDGKLPPLPDSHPNGRIASAHIYSVIKALMGCTIDECRNNRINDILEIVDYCVTYVDVVDVAKLIRSRYAREPTPKPISTLESFIE